MANPFDQFDAAPAAGGNPFDQFDAAPAAPAPRLGTGEPSRGRPLRTRAVEQQREQARPKSWSERMFPELAEPTSRLDPLAAQNQGYADAGAVTGNMLLDSTINLPGQVLGFGGKVAGQVGRNFDPDIDPAQWRQAVTERTTVPGSRRGQQVVADAAAPIVEGWQQNVQPIIDRNPLLGAGLEVAGTVAEGTGYLAGARGLAGVARETAAARGPVRAEVARAPRLSPLEKPPTIDELRVAKDAAYKKADETGVVLSRGAMNRLKVDLVNDLKKEGLDKDLHPKTSAAMKRILESKGQLSLSEIETLRKIANDAKGSIEKSDARLGARIIDKIDEFEETLGESDVVGGDASAATAYKEARALNTRLSKANEIQNLFDRAELTAPNFSGSGMENALRTEFRALAKNERKMRRFNAEEKAAIRKVAMGGPLENTLRQIGKLAPTGGLSTYLGLGAAAVVPGGLAIPVAGGLGRIASTKMTRGNADRALELMRRGKE